MTTKVKGSHVRLDKEKLSTNEFITLVYLAACNVAQSSKDVSTALNIDIRMTTFAISELVGLDLVKATEYSKTPSNQKTGEFKCSTPVYSIPSGTPYSNRSGTVILAGGLLRTLKDPDRDWGGEFWPYKKIDRMELSGEIQIRDGKYYIALWGSNTQKKYAQLYGKKLSVQVNVVDE